MERDRGCGKAQKCQRGRSGDRSRDAFTRGSRRVGARARVRVKRVRRLDLGVSGPRFLMGQANTKVPNRKSLSPECFGGSVVMIALERLFTDRQRRQRAATKAVVAASLFISTSGLVVEFKELPRITGRDVGFRGYQNLTPPVWQRPGRPARKCTCWNAGLGRFRATAHHPLLPDKPLPRTG